MEEKSFRQIEADIETQGFKALLLDSVAQLQNTARTLGYLKDAIDDRELEEKIESATGTIIRTGVKLIDLSRAVEDDFGKIQ